MSNWPYFIALSLVMGLGCSDAKLPQECAEGCPTERPLCSKALEKCVECLEDSQCAEQEGASYCNVAEGECAECIDNAHCAGTPETPVCESETRTCVQCASDSDCQDEDAPACHATTQQCVECTKDNLTACAEFACRLTDSTCTDTERGILGTCDECEADMECSEGRKCLAHAFEGEALGHFCFLEAGGEGCGLFVGERRPYGVTLERTSIDGASAEYCFPPVSTTCQGIGDTQGKVCAADADCGIDGLDDGYCPSAGTGAGVCTYNCTGGVDCADGLDCGGSPPHCRPPP